MRGAKRTCLCTAQLEETLFFHAWCPQTAPPSPGPSLTKARTCGSSMRSSMGRWRPIQTNPAVWPSHPTAPSASATSGCGTLDPTSAWGTTSLSLTFTSPSSQSRLSPPSPTSSLEESSPWPAPSSLIMTQGAASHTQRACSARAGWMRMGESCPTTAGWFLGHFISVNHKDYYHK